MWILRVSASSQHGHTSCLTGHEIRLGRLIATGRDGGAGPYYRVEESSGWIEGLRAITGGGRARLGELVRSPRPVTGSNEHTAAYRKLCRRAACECASWHARPEGALWHLARLAEWM